MADRIVIVEIPYEIAQALMDAYGAGETDWRVGSAR